jgi:hypothetical protein
MLTDISWMEFWTIILLWISTAYREGESEHLDLKLIFPQQKYSLSNRDWKQSSQEMMKTLIVSEWLLFNANLVIFQLYHGENMLIVNEMLVRSASQ